MASLINSTSFREQLLPTLNEAMLEAAEPIVIKALKDIEIRMRKQLASNLISFIDKSFSMETFGNEIRIIIKQEKS